MVPVQKKILVARLAGDLLAAARAAGRGDSHTEGDLVTTCLTDAATLVAYVCDDQRFDVLMQAAELSLEEIDACEPVDRPAPPAGMPETLNHLREVLGAFDADLERAGDGGSPVNGAAMNGGGVPGGENVARASA